MPAFRAAEISACSARFCAVRSTNAVMWPLGISIFVPTDGCVEGDPIRAAIGLDVAILGPDVAVRLEGDAPILAQALAIIGVYLIAHALIAGFFSGNPIDLAPSIIRIETVAFGVGSKYAESIGFADRVEDTLKLLQLGCKRVEYRLRFLQGIRCVAGQCSEPPGLVEAQARKNQPGLDVSGSVCATFSMMGR